MRRLDKAIEMKLETVALSTVSAETYHFPVGVWWISLFRAVIQYFKEKEAGTLNEVKFLHVDKNWVTFASY